MKEKHRDDIDRWDATMEEITLLRKELKAKEDKLSEFEFHCLNLQQSLTVEKKQRKKELEDAEEQLALSSEMMEQRLASSSEMLETCHAQLSIADQELSKERKMKQVLIKINDGLQIEVQRLQGQIVQIREESELQISQTLSMKQTQESDCAGEIMHDLQIEDALFYFEEVKRRCEDPKVYRIFLEIIRDYKAREISTPDVIARISALFQGNSKLIIGFNRFLPKEFHITKEDIADLQSYNGAAMSPASVAAAPTQATAQTAAVVGTAPAPVIVQGHDTGMQWRSRDESSRSSASKSVESKAGAPVEKDSASRSTPRKIGAVHPSKKTNGDQKHQKITKRSSTKDDRSAARSRSSKSSRKSKKKESTPKRENTQKRTPREEKRTPKEARNPKKVSANSKPPLVLAKAPSTSSASVEDPSSPVKLTIKTTSPLNNKGVAPTPALKPSEDLAENANEEASSSALANESALLSAEAAAADAIATPQFDQLNVVNSSADGSSNLFGGIESIEGSFGVGIIAQPSNATREPTDRYEVIEDLEHNAIEMIAAQSLMAQTYNTKLSNSTLSYDYSYSKPQDSGGD